jgi:5-methylcytosine-specific restriction endonuclease McrA
VISTIMTTDITRFSDDVLIAETARAAATERRATADLLMLLIEVERRRLHLSLGHSSMFVFCTRTLRLSEQAAYSRITAARTARRFPDILARLDDGTLSLSSVGLLAPHLTEETAEAMLEAACGKSTREVERLIATWHPQPDVPAVLRALPASSVVAPTAELCADQRTDRVADVTVEPAGQAGERLAPQLVVQTAARPTAPRTVVAPIAPRRYLLKLTINQETHDKLQRARDLLRHSVPDGDTSTILNRALEALILHAEQTKCARSSRPRRGTSTIGRGRNIPAAVKREVWQRDCGRCAFTGADGTCGETAFLEYHHVVPFAAGGLTSAANLELRCRSHNQYEAVVDQSAKRAGLWS